MRLRKWRRVLVGANIAFGAATLLAVEPAAADSVPFQDAHQNGSLTFCNHDEQPITSGKLTDVPFVWTAVSSSPAPAGYSRADLLVFQPIQHVDPSGWEGYQMTVAATFSNSKHPMAQATYADNPLLWPDEAYPPYWDGLYEVRMYFTAPYVSEEKTTYPAAVIQVRGNTWTLLRGGGGVCKVGTAISQESILLPKSKTETPRTIVPNGSSPGRASSGSTVSVPSSGQTGSNASASASGSTPSSSTDASATAPVRGKGSSTPYWLIVPIAIVVAIVAGVVGRWIGRRGRNSPPSDDGTSESGELEVKQAGTYR